MDRKPRIRTLLMLGAVVVASAAIGGCGTTFAYSTHGRHYGYSGPRHSGYGHDRHDYRHGGRSWSGRDGRGGGGHGGGGRGGGGHGGGRGH